MNTKLVTEFVSKALIVKRLIEQTNTVEDKAVTLLQLQALEFIKGNTEVTVGGLANNLSMSLSATTQLINRLADAELINRQTSQTDRRIIYLTLTKKGEEMLVSSIKQLQSQQYSIFNSIPEEDLKEMIRIFTKIIETNS